MRATGILIVGLVLLVSGCGVNKDYVQQQISESETRTDAKIVPLKEQADSNAVEIADLQSLAKQLSEKADMAINQAKGFESYQIIWSGEINFDFDSYEITPVAADILNEAGQKMEQNPSSVLEIAGHTDRTGPPTYNLLLGERRANAAKRYVVDHFGIPLYRLFVISHGEEKPLALPDERNANAKNRRVMLNVWGRL